MERSSFHRCECKARAARAIITWCRARLTCITIDHANGTCGAGCCQAKRPKTFTRIIAKPFRRRTLQFYHFSNCPQPLDRPQGYRGSTACTVLSFAFRAARDVRCRETMPTNVCVSRDGNPKHEGTPKSSPRAARGIFRRACYG